MTVNTDHALDALPGPRVMVQGEADVLDYLRALQGNPRGAAALVRLRTDLDQMIQAATFTELEPRPRADKDALTAERDRLEREVLPAPGASHRLVVAEIEKLEEQIEEADEVILWCPVCDEEVAAHELVAVDTAERWTYADEIEEGEVSLSFDGDADFGDTLYLSHGDPGKGHPVALPEGWEMSA